MIKSNFREWTLDGIDEAFQMEQVAKLPSLEALLAFEYQVNDFEERYLKIIRDSYFLGGEDWNEVELENKIISPIFVFSGISSKEFSYFLERNLETTINEYELSGRVDGMIASGFRNPKMPYFCMNEYKKETDPNGDPKGQALIAMLTAQKLNDDEYPIFGCYIVGRMWVFMALEGKKYALSEAFTVDNNDIFEIYRILKSLKFHIEQRIKLK
jgi:hypothetical protein